MAPGSRSPHCSAEVPTFPSGPPEIHPEVTLRPPCWLFPASPASGVCRARGGAAAVCGVRESPRPLFGVTILIFYRSSACV